MPSATVDDMIVRIRRGANQGRRHHLYIREWMDELDLTDEKVALRIGVERTTVTRWRNQQHRMDPGKIAALAEAMGLQPEELWRPPGPRSLDAMLASAPPEVRQTATDMVALLLKRA